MRYFAREFDSENEEFWGIVGLLHDLDWEEHDDEPEKHTLYAAPLIEGPAVRLSLFVPSKATCQISTPSFPARSFRWKRFCSPQRS